MGVRDPLLRFSATSTRVFEGVKVIFLSEFWVRDELASEASPWRVGFEGSIVTHEFAN